MKLGGLFSGVGGFELAWTQLGHEVAWMCEWDAKARKVLEERFPGVPIYEDVRDLDPAEVEAVDVLTGGSPCQGFSVAGSRTGLEHSESQLFADYIRIMDGLAERGLRYALWENVPGVLSITNEDGERTFNHVVAALAGGTEPVRLREDKRWNTGMAAGRGRAVAWRVLDSRYFGVAQRRRRVFACVAFGDSCEDRAGRALLAVAEGVRGDSASGVAPGEGASEGVAGRAGGESRGGVLEFAGPLTTGGLQSPRGSETSDSGWVFPDVPSGYRMSAFGQYEDDDSASTLKQRDYKDATDLVTQPQAFNWQQGDAEYSLRDDSSSLAADSRPAGLIPQSFDEMNFSTDDETHHVLRAGTKQSTGVMVPQAIPIQDTREVEKHQNGLGVGQEGDPSYTVDTTSRAGVAVPQAFRKAATAQSSEDAESWVADGQANTLNVFDVGDTRTTHAIVEPKEEMVDFGRTSDRIRMNADTAATLQAGGGGEGAKTGLYMVPSDPYVLQGTMVNRTDQNGPGGFGWQRDTSYTLHTADPDFIAGPQYGVRRLTPVECERLQAFPDGWTEPAGSDSARYKAMGNAVTVNVVRWILNRMVQAG